MTFPIVFRAALALPLVALVGCANNEKPEPQDYSPGYSYVATNSSGSEKSVGGSVLAPNACLAEPADGHGLAPALLRQRTQLLP